MSSGMSRRRISGTFVLPLLNFPFTGWIPLRNNKLFGLFFIMSTDNLNYLTSLIYIKERKRFTFTQHIRHFESPSILLLLPGDIQIDATLFDAGSFIWISSQTTVFGMESPR